MSRICHECGMDHWADVLKKERAQEKIRILRRALRMVCGNDKEYKDVLFRAEEEYLSQLSHD